MAQAVPVLCSGMCPCFLLVSSLMILLEKEERCWSPWKLTRQKPFGLMRCVRRLGTQVLVPPWGTEMRICFFGGNLYFSGTKQPMKWQCLLILTFQMFTLGNLKILNTKSVVLNQLFTKLISNELVLSPPVLLWEVCKKILNCHSLVTSENPILLQSGVGAVWFTDKLLVQLLFLHCWSGC